MHVFPLYVNFKQESIKHKIAYFYSHYIIMVKDLFYGFVFHCAVSVHKFMLN